MLDSEAEPIFDTLATLASETCGTPIALLSLVDTGRQWFKANIGLSGVTETPRDIAFCDHAIRDTQVLVVSDAQADARFASNPLVAGSPGIRFYAGAPLVMSSGDRIGTLCVIDRQTRALTASQQSTLEGLAKLAVQALELRERTIEQSLAVRSERERAAADGEARLRAILDAQSDLVSQSLPDGRLLYVNPAYARFCGLGVADLVGTSLYDFVAEHDRPAVRARLEGVLCDGQTLTSENRMFSVEGEERWVSWTNTRQVAADGTFLLHSTGRDITVQIQAGRALAQSQALLERTGRVAGVGGWEVDLPSQRLRWTQETRRIHEVGTDFEPTMENALTFYAPASRLQIERAVQRGLAEGTPWDLELDLLTARGRPVKVRAVGEVEFDQGQPIRMFGAFQDITERRAAEQERQDIAEIFENTSDFVIQGDQDRRVRYLNPAAAQAILGRPWTGATLMLVRDLLPEATRTLFAEEIQPALWSQGTWLGQSKLVLAGGQEVPVSHLVIAHRDESGAIRRYSIIMRDISLLVATQLERERQTATLRSVADAIASTVAVVDREGRYVFVNRAFEQRAGLPREAILGREAREVLGSTEFERRWPWIQKAMAGEPARFEIDADGPSGRRHLAFDYLPLHTSAGEGDGFVVVGQDITEAKQEQTRLHLLSLTDPLTGLLNRAGMEQRLSNLLDPGVAQPLAVLYIDLDRFKQVNDTHGHAAGDELLRQVAKRLTRLVRPSDAVARLGGDEFALALPSLGELPQAERIAQSIVEALAQPFELGGNVTVRIGASVGGAVGSALLEDWAGMLARADRMLYAAKNAGRSRYAFEFGSDASGRVSP